MFAFQEVVNEFFDASLMIWSESGTKGTAWRNVGRTKRRTSSATFCNSDRHGLSNSQRMAWPMAPGVTLTGSIPIR